SYFPTKDDVVQIDDPTFRYESRLTHRGNDVSLECRYQTRTDAVAQDQLDEFLKNREKARGDNSLSFTSSAPDTDEKAATAAVKELGKAADLAKAGKTADAAAALSHLIDSAGFQSLTDTQRHAALFLAGALAAEQSDFACARPVEAKLCNGTGR